MSFRLSEHLGRTVHLGRLWEEVGSRRGPGEAGSLAVVSLRISTTRAAPKQYMLQPLFCAMGDFIRVLVVGSQDWLKRFRWSKNSRV